MTLMERAAFPRLVLWHCNDTHKAVAIGRHILQTATTSCAMAPRTRSWKPTSTTNVGRRRWSGRRSPRCVGSPLRWRPRSR